MKRLGEVGKKVNDKNKNNLIEVVFSNSAIHGIVLQKDYFDKTIANKNNLNGYYMVKPFDFVYNPRISSKGKVGAMSLNKTMITGLVSPLYTVFRIKNKTISIPFLEYFFKSSFWYRYMKGVANYGARDDRMNIKNEDLFNLPIKTPSLSEQTKIATFLSKLDERIDTQMKIIEELEKLIKGYRQKLFSQELRFKDDNGNDFPDWEEKRLGNVVNIQGGYAFKSGLFNQGRSKVLRIGDITPNINTNSTEVGIFSSEIPDNKYIVKKNDYLIALSGATFGKVGKITTEKKAYINQRVATIRTINCLDFFYHLIRTDKFIKYINSIPTVGAQPNISNTDIIKFKSLIPSIEEQNKIAKFLTDLDNKLQTEKEILSAYEEQKKYFLQNMFI